MNSKEIRIVYMGTPDFAVAPLKSLVNQGYRVVGVVTMPDKPVGRHQNVLQASPVKEYALQAGLPVLQPLKLKDEAFLDELRSLEAHLQIVVAFRMLPQTVWSMPPMGTFNLHASLLPRYRGAAPINWALINGEQETGNTTFFLDQEIDTGGIILQERVPIADSDNAGTLHDRLMELGARMVCDTVDRIARGDCHATPQSLITAGVGELPAAPKIFKETCEIDWTMGGRRIFNFVRGLSPYPAAWTTFVQPSGESLVIKIYDTLYEPGTPAAPVGTLFSDGRSYLKVTVSDGTLSILSLQPAGKRRMTIREFLCGYREADMLKIKFPLGA